jgi:glycine/D-amino acid oxidase-like deaminating enzyme
MAAESELFRKHLGIDDEMVPRAEQHREIGTEAYHGGIVLKDVCAVHPARLAAELLDRALGAGATVASRTPVTGVAREGAGFHVETGRGALAVGEVVIASNGYTGPATPYFRRRLVPILSSMIATEPLAPELLARLNPKARMIIDSAKLSFYSRLSPDGARFLFGGTGKPQAELRVIAAELQRQMVALYPELAGARISHAWNGQIGYTFDHLPHLGVHDGIHYALGYCGGGLTMGSYLGHKIALRLLGAKDAATAFDGRRFPTLPLYRGKPWFMPLVYGYYYWRDRVSRSDRRFAAE